jgi:hypothetical protein
LVRASALLEDSTMFERNKKIGGHSAWVIVVKLSGLLLMP